MYRRERWSDLPSALKYEKNGRLLKPKPAIFLDYDGTLTPIVDSPNRATLSPKTRKVLKNLSSLCPVCILSGRDAVDVKRMVGLDNIVYAGSHGFDIVNWKGNRLSKRNWDKFLPFLRFAEKRLRLELKDLPGIFVERKKFAVSLHYRKARRSDVAFVKRRFNQIASQFPLLRRTEGKKVLELLPNIEWNKGRALESLIKALDGKPKYRPVFIGDDLTDEDAFRVIRRHGVGILVGRTKRVTYARYSLRDHIQVRSFLELISSILRKDLKRLSG